MDTKSGVTTYKDVAQDPGILALQGIVQSELTTAISYKEASELSESLISFFEAFYSEGEEDGTGTSC